MPNNDSIIEFLLSPGIKEKVLDDTDLIKAEKGLFELSPKSKYLGLYKEDELVGVIKHEYLTSVSLLIHPYLKPRYLREWLRKDSQIKTDKWFIENRRVHKLIVASPGCCESVIQLAHYVGYNFEGILVGAELWRNKIEDLVFLSRFISGE